MYRPIEPSPRDPRRARDARPSAAAARGLPTVAAPRTVELASLRASPRGAWLFAPMLLLALACGLRFAVRGADPSFELCFAMFLGLGVCWSALRLSSGSTTIALDARARDLADHACTPQGHPATRRRGANSTPIGGPAAQLPRAQPRSDLRRLPFGDLPPGEFRRGRR